MQKAYASFNGWDEATEPIVITVSLPFLWLLFPFSRRWRMYDHAIFTIYSLGFMSLLVIALSVLALIPGAAGFVGLLALAIPPIHLYRQLRGAYSLSRASALWRAVLLVGFATLVLIFWVVLLVLLGAA